jgi:hypothetical protein
MHAWNPPAESERMTRARAIGALAFGGAVVAGATQGARRGGTSIAAPAAGDDVEILNLFLLLEHVQEDFYREALKLKRLDGDLLAFATAVADQERAHVAFLEKRVGDRARPRPESDFGPLLGSADAFRDAAIELEEAVIAAYIGQGANLSRRTLAAIATLVSVEARQAAWVRSIAGVSPAPRAADPSRKAASVVADLRKQGYIR